MCINPHHVVTLIVGCGLLGDLSHRGDLSHTWGFVTHSGGDLSHPGDLSHTVVGIYHTQGIYHMVGIYHTLGDLSQGRDLSHTGGDF